MTAADPTRLPPKPTTVRLPRAIAGWGPVLVAFAVVRLYLLAAAAANGLDGRAGSAWVRWDSGQYLSIAVEGYTLSVSDGRNSRWPPGAYFGNVGWMPGYPLLLRAAHRVGLPLVATGAWLSAGFALLLLRAIDRLVPAGVPGGRRMLVLLLGAFFPGFVWLHAVFPVSLALLLLATAVRLTACGRWAAGGLAGAAAAFTYTSGDLMGPALGTWAVMGDGRGSARAIVRRAVRMLGPAVLPLAGFASALAMQRADTGRWDGIYLVQRTHGHVGAPNPFSEMGRLLRDVRLTGPPVVITTLQVPLVTALWAAVLVMTAWRWSRRSATDRLLAVAAAWSWVGTLAAGTIHHPWRGMAMLTPFVPPLARRLPTGALMALLAAFVVLGWEMCVRFFDASAI